jgi:hypothetical protein
VLRRKIALAATAVVLLTGAFGAQTASAAPLGNCGIVTYAHGARSLCFTGNQGWQRIVIHCYVPAYGRTLRANGPWRSGQGLSQMTCPWAGSRLYHAWVELIW